jgi:hypothetical protein
MLHTSKGPTMAEFKNSRPKARQHSLRPQLELLEDRTTPSGTVGGEVWDFLKKVATGIETMLQNGGGGGGGSGNACKAA